jgi:dihydrofolate synthase / folylpolyglutamate synthase
VTSTPREFLFGLERFGMKFGLENMAALCRALGHPERAFTSIIVGGTNGKGSVTAMVETALRLAGHRAARYTSPHLERLEERYVIDGVEVMADVLDASIERVRAVADALVADGALSAPPTFFECSTAVAFDLFRGAGVEVAIVEVGLGGRLDATNIVSPVAAAIVSIDFDHQQQLGTTLASIAGEKAGIIKPGIPVVCGPMAPEALAVIEAACRERGATLIRAWTDPRRESEIAALPLALRGVHQRVNAAVAWRLLEEVNSLGVAVDDRAIRAGLTGARWPGRLEAFDYRGVRVLIDAAHNPAGSRALASYLREAEPGGVTLVFGAMRDKAVDEMLDALAPVARGVWCTTAPNPRAMPAAELAAMARARGMNAREAADPDEALDRACADGRPVVVAGSIFLIGPIRGRLARGILR